MADLYTKNGKPLTVSGDNVFDRNGKFLGTRQGDKIFDPKGHYAATITDDTAVYRSTDRAAAGSPSTAANTAGSAHAARVGSAIWGDEPFQN